MTVPYKLVMDCLNTRLGKTKGQIALETGLTVRTVRNVIENLGKFVYASSYETDSAGQRNQVPRYKLTLEPQPNATRPPVQTRKQIDARRYAKKKAARELIDNPVNSVFALGQEKKSRARSKDAKSRPRVNGRFVPRQMLAENQTSL